ncbi:MAG: glycosyltransferase family 1 protein [Pseudanabaenaceae cyanobacterium bins.68]|nr:glycosyltransferase family 1 protein [Pseudanabaenaceae cyanobacterium bins.68]
MSTLIINLAFLAERPSGISNYALNLLPHLQDLKPLALSPRPLLNLDCRLVGDRFSSDRGSQAHLARLVWTELRLPSICGSNLLFSPLPEAPLYRGCRYVVTVHDLIPLRFGRSRWSAYFRHVLPQVLAQAQHILVNSQATGDELLKIMQVPSSKITVSPLAYDQAHFRWLDLPRQDYLLYLGRHDRHKNLLGLIQAFAQVPGNCQLYLAGASDRRYTPCLKAAALELGVGGRVHFLDYVPYQDLPKLINQAIALVLPSRWEGFGLPALEAMGCGTPVIASRVGALPEVVGDAGILVNPDQPEELAQAIAQVITQADLRQDLQRRGLAQALKFSWTNTGEITNSLLRQLL